MKKYTAIVSAALIALLSFAGCQKDPHHAQHETTLGEIRSHNQGCNLIVKDVTVVAATSRYNLIYDGTGYAATDALRLEVGKNATIKGRLSNISGFPAITGCQISGVSESGYHYPTPPDITSTLEEFNSSEPQYVTFRALAGDYGSGEMPKALVGETVVTLFYPLPTLALSDFSGHEVQITGYALNSGEITGTYIIATDVVDHGGMTAKWVFNKTTRRANGPSFTGKINPDMHGDYISKISYDEGNHNCWMYTNAGEGTISYVTVDKNIYNPNKYCIQRVDSLGRPNIQGGRAGDFWQFDIDLPMDYAAGTKVNFNALTDGTKGVLKYWSLEILEGSEWVPMKTPVTETVTIGSEQYDVTYTHKMEPLDSDHAQMLEIDQTYTLTSPTRDKNILIRYRTSANISVSGKFKDHPDAGVHRLNESVSIKLIESK